MVQTISKFDTPYPIRTIENTNIFESSLSNSLFSIMNLVFWFQLMQSPSHIWICFNFILQLHAYNLLGFCNRIACRLSPKTKKLHGTFILSKFGYLMVSFLFSASVEKLVRFFIIFVATTRIAWNFFLYCNM